MRTSSYTILKTGLAILKGEMGLNVESVVEKKSYQLLVKALHFGASDIYIEPAPDHYTIQFRKYGKLFPAGHFPIDLGDRIISFFKFKSSLDISEKRKPQSGSFEETFANRMYAFRISTLPSVHKRESLVIRLFLQNASYPITSLSYYRHSAEKLLRLVSKRQGLILLSGATGSGKTTTMYSLVKYCSETLARHVISLEDPVESSQSHMLQIQVNERAGITYASGLKAILRHSPDVIMIGEIRDEETAQIAMRAALSGHLILSTIHAKDTVNCIYRLMDLNVSIEEIRQAVIAIVAQCLIPLKDSEERKAIYEILSENALQEAIQSTMEGREYRLPIEETLEYQKACIESGGAHATTKG